MAHFAEIDDNNIVLRVLVVPDNQEHRGQDFLANDLALGGTWVQTSYNNKIRKKFAGVGYKYNADADVFISPQPAAWFVLNEEHDWYCPANINPETGIEYTENELLLIQLESSLR